MSFPRLLLLETRNEGRGLPENHPAFGKASPDGGTAAYACFGNACLPPVTDPESLRLLLQEHRSRPRTLAANDG
jgi:uncharacterized protein YyaL (SSP411 family)